MNKQILENRTKLFAHNCVKDAVSLEGSKLGSHISGQLIRCSTSVAANYRAANLAHSKAAFTAKLSIVIEEADECGFWLEFASEENILHSSISDPLIKEASELTSIFISSRKSIQLNNK
ncbi:four helix bundle protein [Sunxiuqinia sp. A32]|uniref:four helix bundle protein n=1 Tax=Sunxiuqinia sp. A32 TaxID=3461496 RepID=UPI004045B60F